MRILGNITAVLVNKFYCRMHADKNIENIILTALLFAGGICLGFGNTWSHELSTISTTALIISLLGVLVSLSETKHSATPRWGGALIALVLIYIMTFIYLNVPTVDSNGISHLNNRGWLLNYSKMCVAAALMGLSARSIKDVFTVFIGFCSTTFFLVLAFAISTWINLQKAVYGHIYNILDNVDINSSGMMSLLVVLPCFLAALLTLKKNGTKNYIRQVALIVFLLSSVVAYCFESRSVFIILYLLIPIQISVFLAVSGRIDFPKINPARFMGILLVVVCVIAALAHLKRPIGINIIHDGRMKMINSFAGQLWNEPYRHALVPKEIQLQTTTHYFHNFFADTHRLAGFWGFVASVTLISFIGIRTLLAACVSDYGKVMLMVFIPAFLVLNTSVVPEGEFQPILLILLIGGCTESILGISKGSSLGKIKEA